MSVTPRSGRHSADMGSRRAPGAIVRRCGRPRQGPRPARRDLAGVARPPPSGRGTTRGHRRRLARRREVAGRAPAQRWHRPHGLLFGALVAPTRTRSGGCMPRSEATCSKPIGSTTTDDAAASSCMYATRTGGPRRPRRWQGRRRSHDRPHGVLFTGDHARVDHGDAQRPEQPSSSSDSQQVSSSTTDSGTSPHAPRSPSCWSISRAGGILRSGSISMSPPWSPTASPTSGGATPITTSTPRPPWTDSARCSANGRSPPDRCCWHDHVAGRTHRPPPSPRLGRRALLRRGQVSRRLPPVHPTPDPPPSRDHRHRRRGDRRLGGRRDRARPRRPSRDGPANRGQRRPGRHPQHRSAPGARRSRDVRRRRRSPARRFDRPTGRCARLCARRRGDPTRQDRRRLRRLDLHGGVDPPRGERARGPTAGPDRPAVIGGRQRVHRLGTPGPLRGDARNGRLRAGGHGWRGLSGVAPHPLRRRHLRALPPPRCGLSTEALVDGPDERRRVRRARSRGTGPPRLDDRAASPRPDRHWTGSRRESISSSSARSSNPTPRSPQSPRSCRRRSGAGGAGQRHHPSDPIPTRPSAHG